MHLHLRMWYLDIDAFFLAEFHHILGMSLDTLQRPHCQWACNDHKIILCLSNDGKQLCFDVVQLGTSFLLEFLFSFSSHSSFEIELMTIFFLLKVIFYFMCTFVKWILGLFYLSRCWNFWNAYCEDKTANDKRDRESSNAKYNNNCIIPFHLS